jgi:hypothetical protein
MSFKSEHPAGTVICDECGDRHVAEYSHEGRFGEGAIYAVVCGDLTDYYTTERVTFDEPAPIEMAMSYEEYLEALEAIQEGRASELYHCPVDDSLQGVAATRVVPGHPRGFDGGEVITLRCGHVIA